MLLSMMYAKIHRAVVTHSELHYNGSMGVDRDILDACGMLPGQRIDVLNVNTGARFSTYLIEEPRGSKHFGIYGAAAHLAKKGEIVIVIAYAQMTPEEAKTHKSKVLIMDKDNNVVEAMNQNG
jgi:aspartate 1-decarboxylase